MKFEIETAWGEHVIVTDDRREASRLSKEGELAVFLEEEIDRLALAFPKWSAREPVLKKVCEAKRLLRAWVMPDDGRKLGAEESIADWIREWKRNADEDRMLKEKRS